jgi:hypothetical protein
VFTEHPVPKVYVILTEPTEIPVTTPDAFTAAIKLFRLFHVPPAVASPRVIPAPTQTFDGPVIAAGKGFTVTVTGCMAKQPEAGTVPLI